MIIINNATHMIVNAQNCAHSLYASRESAEQSQLDK